MENPCQVCGQPAQKDIKVAIEVHNLSDRYTSLSQITTKFEVCDLCADAVLERYSKDARNFGMGRMQDGTPRRAIAARSFPVEATDHNGDKVEAEVVDEKPKPTPPLRKKAVRKSEPKLGPVVS